MQGQVELVVERAGMAHKGVEMWLVALEVVVVTPPQVVVKVLCLLVGGAPCQKKRKKNILKHIEGHPGT